MEASAGICRIEPEATRSFTPRFLRRESARPKLLGARLKVETQLIVHLRLDHAATTKPELKEGPDTRPYLARHGGADYAVRGSRIATTVRA